MKKIRVAVVGYGNIGKHAVEAVWAAPDMELAGVLRRPGAETPCVPGVTFADESPQGLALLEKEGKVDAAVLCKPTRMIEAYALQYLAQGIHTVDSFDIHSEIWPLRQRLGVAAQKSGAVAIIAAGWDPGSDSVVRALLEAAAPVGLTYTDFGPGMSMGHTVAVKSKEGVQDALSMTIPLGTGLHRRMVYVQLEEGADLAQISKAIETDPYFASDPLHITQVPDVSALRDKGHGVHLTRKGKSAGTDNQLFTFDMRIHNPALTAQVMVSCARACTRQAPGAYTLIEIPPIDLLPGDREAHIRQLV